ncbi:hypothetical protein ACIRYZ_43155 [Kitasatospora sp. NPDC101155]|uniref:hypothetical protein n=1 Tax=Kitasatospora sp. NPDC101155 TaxID=3364097 RepID=UPI0037F7B297
MLSRASSAARSSTARARRRPTHRIAFVVVKASPWSRPATDSRSGAAQPEVTGWAARELPQLLVPTRKAADEQVGGLPDHAGVNPDRGYDSDK